MIEESARGRVVKSSRGQYANSNVRFLQWLSANEPSVLNGDWVQKVVESTKEGSVWDGNIPRLTDEFKRSMKNLLVVFDKDCPPLLFSSATLTPELFLQWIHTLETGYDSVNTHRSAIRSLFLDYEQPFDSTRWSEEISRIFKGIQKEKAKKRQDGEIVKEKGKRAMPFEVYCSMASSMWKGSGQPQGKGKGRRKQEFRLRPSFTILFMILCWNLMSRSKNVSGIHFSHLGWSNDALTVLFCVTKTNQSGRNMHPRHVYANPLKPEICPILSLGVYLIANDFDSQQTGLFPGGSQYDRFTSSMKLLHEEFKKYYDCIRLYGTHSFRKGAATFCCSGSTAGPTHASVCNRCGWKMQGVQDTYIVYASSGDQYCGRTACGLPLHSHLFAIVAPRFIVADENAEALVQRGIAVCFPSLGALDNQVKKYCLASVVYHRAWLVQTLPEGHELLKTALFTTAGLLDSLGRLVRCGPVQIGESIVATGIPPHVTHLEKLVEVSDGLKQAHQAIERQLGSMCDHVDGACAKMVDDVLSGLDSRQVQSHVTPTMLKDQIREVFNTTGMGEVILEMRQRMDACFVPSAAASLQREGSVAPVSQSVHRTFMWGGKLNRLLPEDFKFPQNAQCREMWVLYVCGNSADGIRPLRDIGFDHFCDKQTRKRASDFFWLMKLIEGKLEDEEVSRGNISPETALQMFDEVKDRINIPVKTGKERTRRVWQLSWRRAFVLLKQGSGQKRVSRRSQENDCSSSDSEEPASEEEIGEEEVRQQTEVPARKRQRAEKE
jgi:hypothetical protein